MLQRLHGLLRRFAWVGLIGVLIGFIGNAVAQDHITQRAWLEDATGRLQWPEVQHKAFKPYDGILSQGFGPSVIWLRLRIEPGTESVTRADALVLRIRPVYLDDIQVYDPLAPQGLVGVTGDQHHPGYQPLNGLDFLVPILRGAQPREIWLRLASTSTRQIDVQALTPDALGRITQIQGLAFSIYLGLVLVLAVWGAVYWLFSREALFGVFGLKQTAALLFAFCSLGFLKSFWPLGWPVWMLGQATSVVSITAVSSAVLFHVLLIREFDPPPWVRGVHLGMLLLWPFKLLLLAAGWPIEALRLNMLEILLSPVIFWVSVLLARGWSGARAAQMVVSRWVAIGFYVLLIGLMVLAALSGLGYAQSGEVGLYALQAHGIFTAFLVMLMLQYRARIKSRQQHHTELALSRSLLQTQQEREVREEQAQLLTMLTHELKTPLATMHMRLDASASGSREIKQAIRDMNNVIERCLQAIQLADQRLEAQVESVNIVALAHDAVYSCSDAERVVLDLPAQAAIHLHTDQQLLFVVLSNLLENACKYSAPGSPITLRLREAGDAHHLALALEVINAPGPAGWPDAQKVFEKYYRHPHARRKAGTGLGLYLVHNLMTILGGQIAYSPADTAIRFVLHVPDMVGKR